MASKRRLRRKTCERKRRYPDEASAFEAARRVGRHTHRVMANYRCPFCHGWHIGHPIAAARRAMQDRRGS